MTAECRRQDWKEMLSRGAWTWEARGQTEPCEEGNSLPGELGDLFPSTLKPRISCQGKQVPAPSWKAWESTRYSVLNALLKDKGNKTKQNRKQREL